MGTMIEQSTELQGASLTGIVRGKNGNQEWILIKTDGGSISIHADSALDIEIIKDGEAESDEDYDNYLLDLISENCTE